jgi:hypothetical protein
MKHRTRILVTLAILAITAGTTGEALSAGATCYGRTPCRACKTCEYCKFCAVNGGKCGVCK